MIEVTLTWSEWTTAATVGLRRHIAAMAQNRVSHGLPTIEFDSHIIGAVAEYIVARAFNLCWRDHVGDLNSRDVGDLIEVRCRRINESGRDLAIRPKDLETKKDFPFVLVHIDGAAFRLVGWITPAEVARDGLGVWNEASQVHYVPGSVPPLHPMDELFPIIEAMRRERVHA